MPNKDGTGPNGQGPLTGRGLGPCGAERSFSRGFRTRFGRGFGWRNRAQIATVQVAPATQPTKAEEKQFLKEELEAIEQEKQEIKQRLKDLKA